MLLFERTAMLLGDIGPGVWTVEAGQGLGVTLGSQSQGLRLRSTTARLTGLVSSGKSSALATALATRSVWRSSISAALLASTPSTGSNLPAWGQPRIIAGRSSPSNSA